MKTDVIVVGAGIIGLAFASEAVRRGKTVRVFDRSPRPEGASVRNFGMIWPIGQRPGADYERAMRSRARWIEIARAAGVWLNECGSLHVAYHDDEMAVLEEFVKLTPGQMQILSADEISARSPAVKRGGLKGGMSSPTECAVNPRTAIAAMAHYLNSTGQAEVNCNSAVTHVESGMAYTADMTCHEADHIFICSGHDFETLFPYDFAPHGIRRCKLQMMKTGPQPNGWRMGPHLAAGLTLTHYKSFETCPTLPALKARFERERPMCVRYGIHVMASQQDTGEVTIGDSHEYDDAITPFDSATIEAEILDYLNTFVDLPDARIDARWHGIYAKHPSRLFVSETIQPGVHIAVAPGGAGMTLSFGLAEDWWTTNA